MGCCLGGADSGLLWPQHATQITAPPEFPVGFENSRFSLTKKSELLLPLATLWDSFPLFNLDGETCLKVETLKDSKMETVELILRCGTDGSVCGQIHKEIREDGRFVYRILNDQDTVQAYVELEVSKRRNRMAPVANVVLLTGSRKRESFFDQKVEDPKVTVRGDLLSKQFRLGMDKKSYAFASTRKATSRDLQFVSLEPGDTELVPKGYGDFGFVVLTVEKEVDLVLILSIVLSILDYTSKSRRIEVSESKGKGVFGHKVIVIDGVSTSESLSVRSDSQDPDFSNYRPMARIRSKAH